MMIWFISTYLSQWAELGGWNRIFSLLADSDLSAPEPELFFLSGLNNFVSIFDHLYIEHIFIVLILL